jgi:eukaryotic-like serine/threonine-protein kinase
MTTEIVLIWNNMNFRKYESFEYKLKIDYPTTWQKIDKTSESQPFVLAFRRLKENPSDSYLESLDIQVRDIPTSNISLSQYIELQIKNLKAVNPDFSLVESTPTNIAGNAAHQIVYIAKGDKRLFISTMKGDKIYNIMYISRPEKYLEYLSTVEQMIASFEFIS